MSLDNDPVMDISSLTFNEIQNKIIQEKKKYFPDYLAHPNLIHTERVIVTDTKRNP